MRQVEASLPVLVPQQRAQRGVEGQGGAGQCGVVRGGAGRGGRLYLYKVSVLRVRQVEASLPILVPQHVVQQAQRDLDVRPVHRRRVRHLTQPAHHVLGDERVHVQSSGVE